LLSQLSRYVTGCDLVGRLEMPPPSSRSPCNNRTNPTHQLISTLSRLHVNKERVLEKNLANTYSYRKHATPQMPFRGGSKRMCQLTMRFLSGKCDSDPCDLCSAGTPCACTWKNNTRSVCIRCSQLATVHRHHRVARVV
jgi:hypothetical protein